MFITAYDHIMQLANERKLRPDKALEALQKHSRNYGTLDWTFDVRAYNVWPETADQLVEIETMALLHHWAVHSQFDTLRDTTRPIADRQKYLFYATVKAGRQISNHLLSRNLIRKAGGARGGGEDPATGLTTFAKYHAVYACTEYVTQLPWAQDGVLDGWTNLYDLIRLYKIFDAAGDRSNAMSLVVYNDKLWIAIENNDSRSKTKIMKSLLMDEKEVAKMDEEDRKNPWLFKTLPDYLDVIPHPGKDNPDTQLIAVASIGKWAKDYTVNELLAWNCDNQTWRTGYYNNGIDKPVKVAHLD